MTQNADHDPLYASSAAIARALSHPHRLTLLDHIAQGERAVERLADLCGLTVANTSQHLQNLKRAGLVDTRRDGKRMLYRLSEGPITKLIAALHRLSTHQHELMAARLAETHRRQEGLEPVSRTELQRRMRSGEVVLLDVRPAEEFRLGRLPGAVNIPLEELTDRLSELAGAGDIVAYCRGPFCALSTDAVLILQEKGYRARKLSDGFPEWKAAGLSVEKDRSVPAR